VNRWSELLLAIAQRKIEQSDLKGAANLARQIPKTSTIHKDAQASINRWQAQWQRGETITIAAQAAMKRGNWTQASEKILAMRELEYSYWRFQQANSLARQMVLEKRARQFLSQARALAKLGGMEQLQQAITQASKMNPKTYAWSDAQKEMKRWGETLLTQSWQQWQAGDLQAAIAIARPVVAVPTLTKEAEALIRLSEARQLARTTDWRWQPKPHHVWHLMEAVAIASQVKPDSRFYAQAQASLAQWRNALEDVSQLQLAQWLTDLNHPAALKLAVAKAEQVSRHRPRRLQAQNLIAHWNREIERMEDAPLLAQARQLAQKGAIANLQAAIAQAQKISPQRALRGEAQALVHDWTQQIQTLQDKPLLDKAWALANQGQLGAAIQVAAQIKAGRSLYGEAQWAIGDWHYQIQQSLLAKTQAPVIAPIEDPIREPYADETPSWSQREPEPQYEEPAPTYQKSDRDKQPPTYRESEPQYEEPPLPTYRDPAYSDVPFPAPPASLPELPPADQAPPLPPAPLPTVDESLPPPAAVPTASPTASETVVEPIVEQPTPANLLSDAS
jgi:soluble cytochrome b562